MLISSIIGKRRDLLVDFEDLSKLLIILDRYDLTWNPWAEIAIGNCGWAKAPSCWFVRFKCLNKVWVSVLKDIKQSKITILPETTGC